MALRPPPSILPSYFPYVFLPFKMSFSSFREKVSSKAEIEAEIERLKARLECAERIKFDPAFTPSELVRWDPSLLGTVLHIKPEKSTPATEHIKMVHKMNQQYRPDTSSAMEIEMLGVLTKEGVCHVKSVNGHLKYNFATSDEFDSMTQMPLHALYVGDHHRQKIDLDKLNITKVPNNGYPHYLLPLANPEQFLLDQIFVATSIRIHDTDVIVDKYPLSALYYEWKRDRDAAPSGRKGNTIRKTELDEAKALIAELQSKVQLLMTAYKKEEVVVEKNALLSESALSPGTVPVENVAQGSSTPPTLEVME